METPELLCHAVPDFCSLRKELDGDGDCYETPDAPCKVQQNQAGSEIVKWISPTRFVVFEDSRWKVETRDPAASLGQYGEKLERETDEPREVYYVQFKAKGECELLPGDKTRVVSTQPVKDQKTSE